MQPHTFPHPMGQRTNPHLITQCGDSAYCTLDHLRFYKMNWKEDGESTFNYGV